MGGNALKNVETRRFTAAEFHPFAARIVAALRARFPDRRIHAIPAYRQKPDFGDLDVLFESGATDVRPDILALFNPQQVVRNGPVMSFDVDGFQVDIIFAASDEYSFSLEYFSWNDCGNLLGRLAHQGGFKFGHDGLSYPLRFGNYQFRTLILTQDFDEALQFLGYDPEVYARAKREGFNTLQDVFTFVASSVFFQKDLFPLEHRSHRARIRDAKRPTYRAFLEWCHRENPPEGAYVPEEWADDTVRKVFWLKRAFSKVIGFPALYAKTMREYNDRKAAKHKFNGERVGTLTGRFGQDLGILMQALKANFPDEASLQAFLLREDQDVIDRWVADVDTATKNTSR